ncbi:MAG: zinc-ribbon domain-containing protein, partial [Oscillospiraceae bacterium]|nr:zinc-ribbon domain-containing protein [Oscillospiraceae bacterium]
MVCTECGTRIKDTAKSCAMCGVKIINPERRNSDLADNVALGVNSELLGRYSEAGKQFKVAYDGIDNETGQKLHQGLKKISQGKVHPDYKEANINQQAGYSAEVLDTAKQNAENIKSGNEKRVSRTDDLGRVNDTKADQVTLDRHGNVVDGSEVQMKFLGVDKKGNLEFLKKVSGKEYSEHYPDGNFRVPSDQYDAIKTGLGEKIQSLENQSPLTPEKQRQLEYLKKVNKNLN